MNLRPFRKIAQLLLLPVSALTLLGVKGWKDCNQELVNEIAHASVRILSVDGSKPGRAVATLRGNGQRSGHATVVTATRAKELFATLRQMPIGHFYLEEGCNRRADLMARRLEELGVVSAKAFAWGNSMYNLLTVRNPYTSRIGQTVYNNWKFHVAPVIVVKDEAGTHSVQALDPALASGPLPVEEWLSKIVAPPGLRTELPKVEPVKLMITERFETDPPGWPDFHLGAFQIKRPKQVWDDQEIAVAIHNCSVYQAKFRREREELWLFRTRAPASTGQDLLHAEKLIPLTLVERPEFVWVTFAGKAAFYRLQKDHPRFSEMKARISGAIRAGKEMPFEWNLVTLELLKLGTD